MKKAIRIITIIILLCGLLFGIWKWNSYRKEQKAIAVATEYLANKYEQEMVLESIHYYWWEVHVYELCFHVKGNENLYFFVIVQEDLTIKEASSESGQRSGSPDDYYLRCFDYKMNQFLQPKVQEIWGDDVSAWIVRGPGGPYAHYVHPDLNDKMTVEEMLPLILGYEITVDIKYGEPDEEELIRRAELLFQYFQWIKENQLEPDYIAYWYTDLKDITTFRNWKEIESADEVLERLKSDIPRIEEGRAKQK